MNMKEKEKMLLNVCGLCKSYERFALQDICFSLEPGYILGVIGKNGSGKSTLIRMLLGSRKGTGEVQLGGCSWSNVVAYRKQLAFVLKDTPFPEIMNAKDCGNYYGKWYDGFDLKKYLHYLEQFQIPEKQAIEKLSTGQKIRQQLAFALSYQAKLYLFDEATANLDVKFRDEVYQSIRQLVATEEKSVIFVSHLVEELEQFADYVLWLHQGKQKYFGTMEDLKEQYCIVEMSKEKLENQFQCSEKDILIGRENAHHQEYLLRTEVVKNCPDLLEYSRYGTIKELMYYLEKVESI